MAKIKEYEGINCPVVLCQRMFSGKWKIILMYMLSMRTFRFNEMQRQLVGITPATLNKQLKELVRDGLVQRKSYQEIPPRVEYSLTEKGYSFTAVLDSMHKFGSQFLIVEKQNDGSDSLPDAGRG